MEKTELQRLARVEIFRRDFEKFAEIQLRIRHSSGGMIAPFRLNAPQKKIETLAQAQLKKHGWIRICCLKSRQWGCSTWSAARGFHAAVLNPNIHTHIIAQDKETTAHVFEMDRLFFDDLEDSVRPMHRYSSTQRLVFENPEEATRTRNPGLRSQITFQTAGRKNPGTGQTIQFLHMCLRGDSFIALADGSLIPIEQIVPGDKIRTHTGVVAAVKALMARPSEEVSPSGRMIEIRTWLNPRPLAVTPDHKIFTRRGWIAAGDLMVDDEIGTAIPKIRDTRKRIALPEIQKRKGPRLITGSIALDKEFGYFVGYYLAEGSLKNSVLGVPSAIDLAHHQSEHGYAQRACQAVGSYITSHKTSDLDGFRSRTALYGSTLATLIAREFGRVDSKTIPEWVFDCSREFLEGIISGYVAGDGSKGIAKQAGYVCPSIYVTSVRVRLLVQLRRILAALGWGWGGLYEKKAFVDHRGWKCQQAWTLSINGIAAEKARAALGWSLDYLDSDVTKSRRAWTTKYKISDGYVWTKIRKLCESTTDLVFDLEVDHADHSFETLVGAVANSECAKYVSTEFLDASILPAVHMQPGTAIIMESTAHPMGDWFHQQCEQAKSGKTDMDFIFVPWFDFPEYARALDRGEKLKLDVEEKFLVKKYGVTEPQLKWRRIMIQKFGGDAHAEQTFEQEFPKDEESAWQSFDFHVFDQRKLFDLGKHIMPPKVIYHVQPGPVAERWNFQMIPSNQPENTLWVWKEPEAGEIYDLGVDVAGGHEDGDFSIVQVIHRRTREQVAEWMGRGLPPLQFAETAMAIGYYYNGGQIGCEIEGIGFATNDAIVNAGYPYVYIWRQRGRTIPTLTTFSGWKSQTDSKALMVARMKQDLSDGVLVFHSHRLMQEMKQFSVFMGAVGEIYRAAPGAHDDLVMAYGISIMINFDESFGEFEKIPDQMSAPPPSEDLPVRLMREHGITVDNSPRPMGFANPLDRMVEELKGWR